MIFRFWGPPGTGKTYMLNRVVYHLIGFEDNSRLFDSYGFELPLGEYELREIAYISFMNSAVDELLGRIGVNRDYRRGEWGTLHGLALHLLIADKVIPRELVTNTFRNSRAGLYYWKRIFTYEFGLPYDPNEEIKTLPGNQLFDGFSYAINVYYPKYRSLSKVIDKLYEILPDPDLVQYAEEWVKFKSERHIIDFDDILILAYKTGVTPHSPVLVVDEFQDFSPLQYEIFKNWAQDREYVFIAGDDDQCITIYSGASPRFILELPGVGADYDVVLRQSFRIAKLIHEASQLYITKYVKYRYPKQFLPRDEDGKVAALKMGYYMVPRLAMKFAKAGKSVLVLARTNSLVREVEELFWNNYVEYHRLKTRAVQIWADFVNKMYTVIWKVRNRKHVPESDLKFFFRFLRIPQKYIDTIVHAFASGSVPLDAYKIFDNPIRLIDHGKVAEYLGSKEKADVALRALKAKLEGKAATLPGKIYLDTIHSAKGREADVVIVMDTMTPRVVEETYMSRDNFEAEARVWYVAMTRARELLLIVPYDMPWVYPALKKVGFKKMVDLMA